MLYIRMHNHNAKPITKLNPATIQSTRNLRVTSLPTPLLGTNSVVLLLSEPLAVHMYSGLRHDVTAPVTKREKSACRQPMVSHSIVVSHRSLGARLATTD